MMHGGIYMKTNMRRISLRVTAQTLYNLERLRKMGELKSLGRALDTLEQEVGCE